MGGVKAYVRDEIGENFRKLAMAVYGYGRGSLSKAAEEAFERWSAEHDKNFPFKLTRVQRVPHLLMHPAG